jgi:hypothetical protein
VRTVSGDLILEELNHIPAIFTFYIENCISSPFLSIISSTFPQNFKPPTGSVVLCFKNKIASKHNDEVRGSQGFPRLYEKIINIEFVLSA